ncbi:MAG: hypothetical protein GX660_05445, partial [Clostridiaceae bacterium]|nr:hypothetical protein [Clostridiaceae bacterium]
MKKLMIVFVLLSLLAGCSRNEPAPSPTDTGSEGNVGVTSSPLAEDNNTVEEINAVDMDRIIEKMLKSWLDAEKLEEYKYKCNEYKDLLYFQKNSKGDFLSTIKDYETENHEVTFGVENNIIDLSDKFKNDKNISLDFSIDSYEIDKYDTLWPVSDITLNIKGNEIEENVKIRSCDGSSTKATEVKSSDIILGYNTYILLVSSDGYVIRDGNKLYVTEVDSDGIGLNNLTVTHIIILPKDVNISAEKSEESAFIQQIDSELKAKGYTINEKKTFIENGTEYLIVFIVKDEIHDNILIYDLLHKKSVFDLKQSGITVPYVDMGAKKTDYFEIADKNNDGVKEIIFKGEPVASSPGEVLMINKQKEGFGIIFFDEIDNYQFIELNGDNVKELYGNTRYGGQVSYDAGFSTVYEFKNNKYTPSYGLTRNYESIKIKEYEQEFKKNPNIETLDKLIFLYAYLGEKDKCIKLKEDNKALIKGVDDPENNDYF